MSTPGRTPRRRAPRPVGGRRGRGQGPIQAYGEPVRTLRSDDPLAAELMRVIRAGDLATLTGLLDADPDLATTFIEGRQSGRSLLHVATDWPGHYPNGAAVVVALVAAGADPSVNAGPGTETPLHWAASSDDVEVAATLLDRGADIEAPGGCLTGGPPLENAVAFGQWQVARLLVDRGARVDTLWVAAALGMTTEVADFCSQVPLPSPEDINTAFWQACHGGQRRTAEFLLGRGADVNASPDYADETPLDIATSTDDRRGHLATWLVEHGARGRSA